MFYPFLLEESTHWLIVAFVRLIRPGSSCRSGLDYQRLAVHVASLLPPQSPRGRIRAMSLLGTGAIIGVRNEAGGNV